MPSHPTRFQAERTGYKYLQFVKAKGYTHPGIDYNWSFGDSDRGQAVISPTWAVVEYVSPKGYNNGMGQYVVLYHPYHGVWTRYMHLDSAFVYGGQRLAKDQPIGTLGDSGTSSAHLHFEVLNANGIEYIRNHTLPYGRYTNGLSYAQVAEKWLDPEAWIANASDPPYDQVLRDLLEKWQKALFRANTMRKNALTRAINRVRAKLDMI